MLKLYQTQATLFCISLFFFTSLAGNTNIKELRIFTYIRHRFANTNVTCLMHNDQNTAQEAVFTLQLPDSAFISNFSMLINGELRVGEVKEKESAAATYNTERSQGRTTGLVAKARDSNSFSLRVSVAARSDVVFQLQYQEALKRTHGFYQHKINFNPGQIVDIFDVQVSIDESRDLSRLMVPRIRYNTKGTQQANFFREREISSVIQPTGNRAEIRFNPTRAQQAGMSEMGVVGQFIVRYDVVNDGADIQMVDGHYVHFFHPENLEPFKKAVVFVLDDSGSMSGRKITQLKNSMDYILSSLRSGDKFSVVSFSSSISVWNQSLIDVYPSTINSARQFTNSLQARGGTNINDGLLKGCQILGNTPESHVPIIVFLTDGHPSASETNIDRIIANVERANTKPSLIYSLAYGSGADFDFLKKLSTRNYGFAKKIYEDNDAAEQLQNFFFEIENPLLRDVEYTYLSPSGNHNSPVGKTIAFSKGGDIIFHGKIDNVDNTLSKNFLMKGKAADGKSYENYLTVNEAPQESSLNQYSLERLWAYVTINDMLKQLDQVDSEVEKEIVRGEVLQYSLQYNFVTPLTSLVVTQGTMGDSGTTMLEDESSPAGRHLSKQLPGVAGPGAGGSPRIASRARIAARHRPGARHGLMVPASRNRIPMVLATIPPPTPPTTLRRLTTTTTTTTTRAPLAHFIQPDLLDSLPVDSRDAQFRLRRGDSSLCFGLPVKSSTTTVLLEDAVKGYKVMGTFGKAGTPGQFPTLVSISVTRKETIRLSTGPDDQHVYDLDTGLSLHIHTTATGLSVDVVHSGSRSACSRYEGLLESIICNDPTANSGIIKPRWPVSGVNGDTCTFVTSSQLGF